MQRLKMTLRIILVWSIFSIDMAMQATEYNRSYTIAIKRKKVESTNEGTIDRPQQPEAHFSLADCLDTEDEQEMAREIAEQQAPSQFTEYMQSVGIRLLIAYLDVQEYITKKWYWFTGQEEQ